MADVRVERLDLVAYGHLVGQRLDELAATPGLTVVLGPNEAGKSTTMRALTALLFGIERGSADHFGRGRESLRVGGRLVAGDGTVLEVVRQGIRSKPLVGPDGASVDEGRLADLLGGADRALFTSLFRIDHEELRHRSQELLDGDGELGRLVFGAGLGSTSLSRLLASLHDRCDELFLPQGRVQEIPSALRQVRDLQREVRDLRTRSRDWERAREAAEVAAQRVATLREERAEARLAHEHLVRLQGALPLLAERSDALAKLVAAKASGPVQTPAWAERVEGLVARRDESASGVRALADDLERLGRQLAEVEVPADLLVHAEVIDRLVAGTDRYDKDTGDLPDLRAKLAAATAGIASLSGRVGLALDEARSVTEVQLGEIDRLAGDLDAAESTRRAAEDEERASRAAVADLQVALTQAPEPADAAPLRHQLEAAGAVAARHDDMAAAADEAERLRGDLRAALSRLGLDPSGDIEGRVLPERSDIHRAVEHRAGLQGTVTQLQERLVEEDDEVAALERHVEELAAAPGLPDAGAVPDARRRRDDQWARVRVAWLGAPGALRGAVPARDAGDRVDATRPSSHLVGAPGDRGAPVPGGGTGAALDGGDPLALAAALERATADADRAEDDRFGHASHLERLAGARARLRAAAERRDLVRRQVADARRELDQWVAGWAALWTDRELPVASPEEGSDRLEQLAAAQRTAAEARQQQVAVDRWHDACARHRSALAEAMVAAGLVPTHGELVALAAHARDAVAEADRAHQSRAELQRRLAEAEQEHARRRAGLDQVAARCSALRQSWSDALVPLRLPATTSTAAARTTATAVRELCTAAQLADDLRRRVAGLERDVTMFADKVIAAVAAAAPDLVGLDVPVALGTLRRRLDAAQAADTERKTLQKEEAELTDRHRRLEARLAEHQAALAELRTSAGIGSDDPLEPHLERAGAVHRLRERIASAEARLLAQGAGPTVDAIAAAAGQHGTDAARVAVAVDEAKEHLDGLDDRLVEATDRLGNARRTVDAVDGAGRAADAEQQAEIALAGLADAVDGYARHALAREVLRRVVDDYGRRNQAPLVTRASAHFARLTGGSFGGLLVDGDLEGQRLLASRNDGQVHEVGELSEGTVDQLYLALRLAGIEHHLDRASEPLPVVLDDLLVNFDDGRAAAALDVLADLGTRTQVLLFTHHRHLVDLARDTLGPGRLNVAELSARVAAAAPAVRSRGDMPAGVRGDMPAGVRVDTPAGVRVDTPQRAGCQPVPAASPGAEPAHLDLGHGTVPAGAARSHVEAVVSVLSDASAPLGRGDLLARTGIPESEWVVTIRNLVDSGTVVQHGATRGTRYRLA